MLQADFKRLTILHMSDVRSTNRLAIQQNGIISAVKFIRPIVDYDFYNMLTIHDYLAVATSVVPVLPVLS